MIALSNSTVRYGVIGGLVLSVLGILFRIAGISVGSPLALAFYLLLPVVAWFVIADMRRESGMPEFKAMFRSGSVATMITSGIYAVSVLAYNQLIDASLLADVRAYSYESAISAGKSGEALETANRLAQIFTQPVIFEITVFIQLAATGASAALGLAIFEKWRRQRTGRA